MNLAIIFAGGVGNRMHQTSRPKQFLQLNGKPVIIYTLEVFENHPDIDAIVVACIKSWIPYLRKQLKKFGVTKVVSIVPGGETGQESIYNGLCAANDFIIEQNEDNAIVLIHDGVRPLINEKTITTNIQQVKESGSSITTSPATETILIKQEHNTIKVPDRDLSLIARAPQCFWLKDILSAHCKAKEEGLTNFTDSCSLMNHYGYELALVEGPEENIKITSPMDFYIFRALIQMRENEQIW